MLTLGLGIGACTVIFSVAYPILISPLPYPRSDEITVLSEVSPGPDGSKGWVSPLTFRDWQERSEHFERIASYRLNLFTWTGDAEPAMLRGWAVSEDYFPLLGVGMTLGRGFTADEDLPGGERVVVISYAFWRQHFGSDRDVLGRTMTLDGSPYTIVGVASPSIDFPSRGDYWIPAATDYSREMRDFRYLGVLGRLRPGSSLQDARAGLERISRQVETEHPETNSGWGADVTGLRDRQVGRVRPVLVGMAVAVVLLLIIAIGNTTNLAIARSTGRQTDTAVRLALGAGRPAITRQFVTEALLLSLAGCALGVLLAAWGTPAFATTALPRVEEVTVDTRCLVFALTAAAVVGLALGLLSAFVSGGRNLSETLRAGGPGRTAPTRAHRIREAVLTTQVGLALSLLIGATLLAQSLWTLGRVDAGFSPDSLLTFSYDLPGSSYPDPAAERAFYRDALSRIQSIPGVEAAGIVTPIPMEMGSVPTSWSLSAEVADPSNQIAMAHMRNVTSGYFETMGIRLLSGRLISDADREDSEQIALVNRSFVDRYLRGHDPLGVRVSPGEPSADETDWLTIVGVVDDVRFRALTAAAEPEIYLPMLQVPSGWGHLVVRSGNPPDELARSVTQAVQTVDPDLPLADTKTGEEIIAGQLRISRLSTKLTSLFAILATLMAAVGILGVHSIVVAQRMKEIGLRMVLGAQPAGIWRFALLRGMRPVLSGIALGIGVSLAATRLLESQVYDVNTLNAMAFFLPGTGLVAVGLLACLVPSARASAADPVDLLRSE
jgi:predicted permease